MIGLAGTYDFLPPRNKSMKEIFGPPEQYEQSQPGNFVDGDEPPILLLHGGVDYIVKLRSSESLNKEIQAHGGCVKMVVYPTLGHARILLALSQSFRRSDVLAEIEQFVRAPACKKDPEAARTRAAGDF
jgi:dipeptidyl aminopeptidase/acylaminoacyl peptidase